MCIVIFNMKTFCGILVALIIVSDASCKSLVRKKRFFNSLWPVEEAKTDVQNGLIYSNLPPEYLFLLPGVNDHKEVNRRNGEEVPARFVHPTRMAILMQPHLQQRTSTQLQKLPIGAVKLQPVSVQPNQQQGPKIVMKPFAQTTKLNPSITLKTKEQALPDIHKNHRFVPMKPAHNIAAKPLFNPHQQLPIKKLFEESPQASTSFLSIKSARMEDFYYTKEFNALLNKFNIKAELAKLPPISDVMAILGTDNAEDTLNAIQEVTESKEGMELIRSYLDQTEDQNVGDEFYNYDEDVGAGEIQVNGSEDVKYAQSYPNPGQQYRPPTVFSTGESPQELILEATPVRASTVGTLTGGERSWWKPASWFSSGTSTKVDSLKKDADILKNVVPSASFLKNVNYVRKFMTPINVDRVPINQPFSIDQRRDFLQTSLEAPSADTQTLPIIRMTEAQFQDMVEKLRLTPINVPNLRASQRVQTSEIATQSSKITTEATEATTEPSQSATTTKSSVELQENIEAPIIVHSAKTGISNSFVPLPSTFPQFEERQQEAPQFYQELPFANSPQDNRRNFVAVSTPERASPHDFMATGRIHQANPDEVNKRSRSLAQANEEEKTVVASISALTEQHQVDHESN